MKKYIFICLIFIFIFTGCAAPDDTLSINGLYLGKQVNPSRDILVMDASFTYMIDDVGFSVDSDDRINYMEFYTSKNASGEITCGLSDIKLIYHGEHLDTTEKVIEYLCGNYTPIEGESHVTFTFEDDELTAQISLVGGEFNGITVSPR